jgi:hypothetical protein
MTIFSRLFGKRPAAAQVQVAPAVLETPVVDRALFVEEPEQEVSKGIPEDETVLADLLVRDYESMGRKDGHEYHDLDRMEFQLELIAADFRQAYDKELQEVEHQMSELEPYLVDKTREVAPDLFVKLETKHKSLLRKQRDLLLQKDLAMTGEGYIESAVKYYKAGFLSGFGLRMKEDVIFKHVKIM